MPPKHADFSVLQRYNRARPDNIRSIPLPRSKSGGFAQPFTSSHTRARYPHPANPPKSAAGQCVGQLGTAMPYSGKSIQRENANLKPAPISSADAVSGIITYGDISGVANPQQSP